MGSWCSPSPARNWPCGVPALLGLEGKGRPTLVGLHTMEAIYHRLTAVAFALIPLCASLYQQPLDGSELL